MVVNSGSKCNLLLGIYHPFHLCFHVIVLHMSVSIQGDANVRVSHQILQTFNIKPSLRLTKSSFNGYNWEKSIEHRKSATRCKVEHIFLIVKRQFGYSKVVYRGIAKNFNRFYVLFASTNIVMCLRAKRSEEFALG